MAENQRIVSARGGLSLPALDLGTWKMGEKRGKEKPKWRPSGTASILASG